MTDQEIIEAMARAICKASGWKPDAIHAGKPFWTFYTKQAEAAHAICAPAVRERCAEAARSAPCHADESDIEAIVDAIEALPLAGLPAAPAQSKGESE